MNLDRDWDYILQVAEHRLENNKTPRHRSELGTDIEVIGVAGELIARRVLGLPERLHEHWDGGIDIRFNGLTIDVKATQLITQPEYRFLQWPSGKRVVAQVILMAAIDLRKRRGVCLGYATRDEVLQSPVNQSRKYPCREIPVRDLHPTWHLLSDGMVAGIQHSLL